MRREQPAAALDAQRAVDRALQWPSHRMGLGLGFADEQRVRGADRSALVEAHFDGAEI
jgi:hypothetical protein